jgi:hypothetical protein
METTELTAVTLRKRMQERGVSQTALARACGMQQSDVCGILNGWIRIGPRREARLAAGIVKLGLDTDTPPTPPAPPAEPTVIRIRKL